MIKLHNLIAQSSFPEETKFVLQQIQVKKIKIVQKDKCIILQVALPSGITKEDTDIFCDLVRISIPQVQMVSLEPLKSKSLLSLKELINYQESLTNYLNQKVPGIKNWLGMTRWQIRENTLFLSLPHLLALEIFDQKGVCRYLENIIQELYGIALDVDLEIQADLMEKFQSQVEIIERNQLMDFHQERVNRKDKLEKSTVSSRVIFGKIIKGTAVPIEQVVEEEKSVVVQGEIFALQKRELKSGNTLVVFDITDYTNSLTVKLFVDAKNTSAMLDDLKKGHWVKVRGPVRTDKFSQDLTLMAYHINQEIAPKRLDTAPEKRVELHLHTKMSPMDSVADIHEIIALAAKFGHQAIAITDHGVVQAFPEAYEAGRKYGIKIIFGVEGYLIDDENNNIPWKKQKSYHFVILVKNQIGLMNLYKLISLSHLDYFYRTPKILKSILRKHREGLILGTACEAGELYRGVLSKASTEELINIAQFYDFLEIQPLGNNEFMIRNDEVEDQEELIAINKKIIEIGKQSGKLVVATGDVHFIEKNDAIYRKILMAGKGFADETQAPLYYRTTEEMLQEFFYLKTEEAQEFVITNPNLIADQIDEIAPIPLDFYAPEISGAEEQVQEMTLSQAKLLYGNKLPEIVQARIDKELNSIIKNGFSVLYFIAHKLVKKSNDDGYLVGSRGSVGSSFVATLMGITEVNPLPPHYLCEKCQYNEFINDGSIGSGADLMDKPCPVCGTALAKDGHDIPFETFLGFHGDKIPDIDLNFSGDYQPMAHRYVEELFGKDYVFRAGTISTIAERTSYGFVKNYLDERKIQVRDAEINRLVAGCSGVKKTTGQHPGGLMVVPKNTDIHQFTPLQRPADDQKSQVITTHFDYHAISSRLVKLDILGHDDPTVIKMLEEMTGVDAREIKLDDQKTLSIFSGVEALQVQPEDIRTNIGTYGIPEFGTKFVRQMLADTQPKSFSELVRISGFSHGTDVWLNNAQDLIKEGVCKTSEAISTRDDIMVYLIYKGLDPQIAFKIMEDARKGKGVRPEHEVVMREHQVPAWYIESCKKIKYMFPKAHATAYVTMAFRIAWFKVNYPEAFYTAYFSVRADDFDADLIVKGPKTIGQAIEDIEAKGREATQKEKNMISILEVALEMYQRGIKLLPVDIELSLARRFKITETGILPPLASLQGLGSAAAQNIVEAREEKPFITWDDIRARGKASKPVIDILASHGCIKHLPESSQMCLF